MKWLREALMAALSVLVLVVVMPFIPTGVFIQQRGLTVEYPHYYSTRTVTFPSMGGLSVEVMDGGHVLVDCNQSSERTHFEERGLDPIQADLKCDLSDGVYTLRYCVWAIGPFGIELAPSCLEAEFIVGLPVIERQQMLIENLKVDIQELQEEVKR